MKAIALSLSVAALPMCLGCEARIVIPVDGSAAIVGTIGPAGFSGKDTASTQLACPDVVVRLNNNVVNVDLDDDCTFLIDDVQPAANVVLLVEVPALGVSGSIELDNVSAAELIEIRVEADDDSLDISVLRRAAPDLVDELPLVIDRNNVTLFIAAGTHDESLTVDGNNFTLVGVAGANCDASGWSVITGDVLVLKNNATFRNIRFEGAVEVAGNNARFINSCLGGELVIFGHNTTFGDDDDEDDDDGEDDDHDDDEDDEDDD